MQIFIDATPDGEIILKTPYSRDFVSALKERIQKHGRRWDAGLRVWIITAADFRVARDIIEENFGKDWVISDSADLLINPHGRSPFDLLFVKRDAPECVIKAAYKALSLNNHPDRGGSNADMVRLNIAFEDALNHRKRGG